MKNILNIIKYNFKTLVEFELLFKIMITIIIIPIVIFILNITMKLSGYTYLTIENISSFLLNPITILMIIIIIIILSIITIFDISTLIIIYDNSYHKQKIDIKGAITISLNRIKKIFKQKNILIVLFILFLIPFLNIGLSLNTISTIKIPEFILEYIFSNTYTYLIYILIYIFLLIIIYKWIYSLHYIIIEEKDFKESRILSNSLTKNNRIKDILIIITIEFIISCIFILFITIEIFIIYIILNKYKIIESIILSIIRLLIVINILLFTNISNGINYAIISSLFYKHKKNIKEIITPIKYIETIKVKRNKKILNSVAVIIIILSFISGTIFMYQLLTGKTNLNIEYVKKMEITAHRGASVDYPENTMIAFKKAKELGADWIELDVQQTKDNRIVVSHDTNLKRTTGLDEEIINLNYDIVLDLEAGRFKNKKFKGERIPLLEDVIRFAKKNNIRLNIELKPTGKEKKFEKNVIDLIKKYHYEDRCVVTSQVYSVVKNIKKIDKKIKTVYVISKVEQDITKLKYVDAYSVEKSNVNYKLVNSVHNKGKELYVWTVNTEESITNMIKMNVDNIITDNIELGKNAVNKSKNSYIVNKVIETLK